MQFQASSTGRVSFHLPLNIAPSGLRKDPDPCTLQVERERGREWAHMSESDNQLPSLCQGPEISEADVENHLVILRGIAWASRDPFTNYKKCI